MFSQEQLKNLTSTIDSVTVFLQKAEISRSAPVQILEGKSTLIFTSLADGIDESSLQVRADGPITILSVSYQLNYLQENSQREDIRVLTQRKKGLIQDSVEQHSLLKVFLAEEELLRNNQKIGGNNVGLDLDQLRAIADFQRKRMTEVLLRQNEIRYELTMIRDTLARIGQQLISIQERTERPSGEVVVTVSAERSANASFVLSYIVPQAGWFTQYDVRVDQINEPIQLHYKAQVYQNTGEDWKEVKIKLSSGNPSESGTQPELKPWDISYNTSYNRNGYVGNRLNNYPTAGMRGISEVLGRVVDQATAEPLYGATVLVAGTNVGTITDQNGFFSLQVPPDARALTFSYIGMDKRTVPIQQENMDIVLQESRLQLEEVVVTGYDKLQGKAAGVVVRDKKGRVLADQEADIMQSIPLETEVQLRSTTFLFDIEEPYTIVSDGKMHTVDITQYSVEADYQYFSVPKLDLDAFLTARITDWESLNLLPGEANLFLEGTFIGNALINPDDVEDTLYISLGRDKGIGIMREKQKDYSRRQTIGGNQTDSRAYEIIVRNNKPQPISITIQDQFPRSTRKDIQITEVNYEGAKLDPVSRKLTWELTLQPGEIKKLSFAYEVKYPKDQSVVLE